MKLVISIIALTTSLFARAYECEGKDSSGNAIKIKTSIQNEVNFVTLNLGPKSYKEAVELSFFHDSSMGRSRCPVVWSGITFEGQNSKSAFKSLSIVTEEYFPGCGFAHSDTMTLALEGSTEIVYLSCNIDG